jgi:hypothetical protein
MSSNEPGAEGAQQGSDDDLRKPTGGDEERENREHLEQTGEPQEDALGNQDGAS